MAPYDEIEITIVDPDNTPPSPPPVSALKSWLVIITAALLFFYTFIQLNMLNVTGSAIMRDFSINAEQFGTLSSLYFYGNFFLLFPAGLLLDRFSPRKLILFAMALCVLTMFGFAFSTTFWMASLNRFLSGVAGAFAFLSCIRLASRWFPPQKLALASGFIVTMAFIGGMVAQTPVSMLSDAYGWQHTMVGLGVLGIALFIFMFFIIRDWPNAALEKTHDAEMESIGFWHSIKMVLGNPYNWLGGLYTALMNLPIFLLAALWGSMYLVQVQHLSHTQSSYVTAMIFFGAMIGSPLIGWISDQMRSRTLPMLVGAILSLVIILLIMYSPHLNLFSLLVLFFMLGLITSAQVLSYPTIAELNSPLVTGSAISIISLLIMSSGFVFQPLFGLLMDLHWKHMIVHNVAVYSITDFKTALIILPVAFVSSIAIALLIKETNCQQVVSEEE